MKKIAPIAVVFGILVLAVIWINQKPKSPQSTPVTATENTPSDETLIVVTPWEITATDPSKSGFIFQRLQLAETLVDADDNAKLIAGLATEWHATENGKVWTFKLRENVKFHDGTPLTADNVVKSLTVALTKPTALEQAGIERIEKADTHSVVFHLKAPLQAFPAYLAHSTAIILADAAFDENNEVTAVIGTGPYMATKIEAPQKIEQVAFADYWGENAKIAKIEYLANSRSESRTLLAQSSKNHLVYNLDAASIERLSTDDNLSLHNKSIARTIQYKMNAKHPLFSDAKFRRVLSQAIDREGIAKEVLKIENGVANQILPPLFADWQIGINNTKPDYTALRQELISLNFRQDDKGNLFDKDGKPVRFSLKTFSDRPELPIIATALQNQWQQLGIQVDVAVGNFSDIPASHQNGTLEMALYARNYGLIPDPVGALMEDFSEQGSDWGVMNWHNPALNDALNALNSSETADPTALKHTISQIIYEEQPLTPVVYYQQNVAHHKSLKGVELDALERSFRLNKMSW